MPKTVRTSARAGNASKSRDASNIKEANNIREDNKSNKPETLYMFIWDISNHKFLLKFR
jgi:hypothetical protein